MLPHTVHDAMSRQLAWRKRLHDQDLNRGNGWVELPNALGRKLKRAEYDISWQFVFAASRIGRDPRTGQIGRYHLHESSLQRQVKAAAKNAGLMKRVTCHTFRHSFATHMLEDGYDIRTVQKHLGHRSVQTTMVYTHAMQSGVAGVRSPLDALGATNQQIRQVV